MALLREVRPIAIEIRARLAVIGKSARVVIPLAIGRAGGVRRASAHLVDRSGRVVVTEVNSPVAQTHRGGIRILDGDGLAVSADMMTYVSTRNRIAAKGAGRLPITTVRVCARRRLDRYNEAGGHKQASQQAKDFLGHGSLQG